MVESQTGGDKQAILGGIVRARSADRALPSSLFPAGNQCAKDAWHVAEAPFVRRFFVSKSMIMGL